MIILETDRLILRDFEPNDLDAIYTLVYADRQVKDTWSGVSGTPEEIKQRFADLTIRSTSRFGYKALVEKQTNTLVGLMGYQSHDRAQGDEIDYLLSEETPHRTVNYDPDCLEVELTYALGRAYWKKGYATEMGKAMIAYGFQTLGIGRIIQGALAQNENSIGLMRRLGFTIEHGLRSGTIVGILSRPGLEKFD
jgi:RimJ/RimL family protein N-acetyltransferase